MSTYACRTQDCKGILIFQDPPSNQIDNDSGLARERAGLTTVDETPTQCSECHTSYYRYELE